MKKNGFTLVELLAVIVILGIIMTIASSSLITTKKEANIREAKQIEKSIKDLGMEIYSYEKTLGIYDDKTYCEKGLGGIYDENEENCDSIDFAKGTYKKGTYKEYFNHIYSENSEVYIEFKELYDAGYLKNIVTDDSGNFSGIKNPAKGDACTGYLHISNGEFNSCLNCSGIEGYKDTDCTITGVTALLTK